jgi:hypothetical protein
MVDYFLGSEPSFLTGMGVDTRKMPSREKWLGDLLKDHQKADAQLSAQVHSLTLVYRVWTVDRAPRLFKPVRSVERRDVAAARIVEHLNVFVYGVRDERQRVRFV